MGEDGASLSPLPAPSSTCIRPEQGKPGSSAIAETAKPLFKSLLQIPDAQGAGSRGRSRIISQGLLGSGQNKPQEESIPNNRVALPKLTQSVCWC